MISDDPGLAAQKIREGKIVIFPTETVYGIGADALNKKACNRIYDIKNRPRDNPLIWHFSDWNKAKEYVSWHSEAEDIASIWPQGPITMILNSEISAQTIACRVPKLETTRSFLELCGTPVAAPSANISGRPSLTRFSRVVSYFSGKVDLILQGPDSELGLESTVIDLTDRANITILRPGHISANELRERLNLKINNGETKHTVKSPGTKYKHYSPDKPVLLVEQFPIKRDNEARIGFHIEDQDQRDYLVQDNLDYAKNLYAFLENSDQEKSIGMIYCQYPLDDKLKESLLNRLLKACNQKSDSEI